MAAGERLSARTLAYLFNTGAAGLPLGPPRLFRGRDAGLMQIAVHGGRVIGWAEARPGGVAWEVAVAVIDDCQHCGIGSALVYALLKQCHKEGVGAAYEDIAPDNTAAGALQRSVLRAGIPLFGRRLMNTAA